MESAEDNIWYKVYIQNDEVYIQYDIEEMSGSNREPTDDIRKCTTITADEFMKYLSIKE